MLPALTNAKQQQHVRLDNRNGNSNNNSSSNNNNNNNSNKRNSSMIFRIEHLIPTSVAAASVAAATPTPSLAVTAATAAAATSSLAASSAGGGAKQRSGVYVSQRTPKGTLSEAITTHALIAQAAAAAATLEPPPAMRTYCTLSQRVLCMTPSILRRIKLAEDVPSYNALFELHGSGEAGGGVGGGGGGGGHVRVRIIRDIERDEEIVAWFGDELTMLMGIPFLAPLHILGNSRYTCHLCQLTFETPNPLKVHLALACGRHSMDILWLRLHYAVRAATAVAAAAAHQLLPAQTLALTPGCTSPPTTLNTATTPPAPRFSAFKPITPAALSPQQTATAASAMAQPPPALATTAPAAASTSTTLTFLPAMASVSLVPSMAMLPPAPQHAAPLNAAAQIEAIVSNMGASKQGHLCIYCGKVYSRKYGLKIHIRTHTGFKPLKCKFCLRPFGDPSNLNKHVRLHLQGSGGSSAALSAAAGAAGEAGGTDSGTAMAEFTNAEGFKCHVCHKVLARRRDLQRHLQHHHHQQLQHHQATHTSHAV